MLKKPNTKDKLVAIKARKIGPAVKRGTDAGEHSNLRIQPPLKSAGHIPAPGIRTPFKDARGQQSTHGEFIREGLRQLEEQKRKKKK